MSSFDERRVPPSGRAVRLTFTTRGDKVELRRVQHVEMTAPMSDPLDDDRESAPGFSCELRTGKGDLVYRRTLPDAARGVVEAPSGDPDRPFTRTVVEDREHVFQIVVPDMGEVTSLSLRGSPAAQVSDAAGEIGRFDIDVSDITYDDPKQGRERGKGEA